MKNNTKLEVESERERREKSHLIYFVYLQKKTQYLSYLQNSDYDRKNYRTVP